MPEIPQLMMLYIGRACCIGLHWLHWFALVELSSSWVAPGPGPHWFGLVRIRLAWRALVSWVSRAQHETFRYRINRLGRLDAEQSDRELSFRWSRQRNNQRENTIR